MQFDLFAQAPAPPPPRPSAEMEYTEHTVGNPAKLRGYMARRVGGLGWVTFLVPARQFERYTQEQRDQMLERFKQKISEE